MKKVIATTEAPAAVGPYSQAIALGNFLFAAGQIPLDPSTNELVSTDITAQTERVCQNISAVLKANDMTFTNVVKTTVFLKDMNDFGEMNAVYGEFFRSDPPARATVEVSRLPRDVSVEIDCIAVL